MEEIIIDIVNTVFGSRYKNVEQIVGKGKNNQVFKIEIGDTLYILRLFNSVRQLALYEKEKWCAQIAREAEVKTPAITHTGFLNGWSYSFQIYVEGTHGTEVDEKEIWFKIGQVAKIIHQIPVPGIALNYNQKVDSLFASDYFMETHIFSPKLSAAVKARLKESAVWKFFPMLCHGNLHPSNVILDSNDELWLLDWETASGNLALEADLAEIYTWNNGKDNIIKFSEGYGLAAIDIQNKMRDIQTLVLLRMVEVTKKMLLRDGVNTDTKNKYIKDTVRRLEEIPDYHADILFTKNL